MANLTFSRTTLNYTSFDRAQLKESNGAILFVAMSSAHASSPLPRREGPELPLSRPTLATTHPQLACLGETIISEISEIMDDGSTDGGDLGAALERLPDLFIKVTDFVGTALVVQGSYDNVAYWVEQTFKTVQKLGKASSIGTPPLSGLVEVTTYAVINWYL